MAHDGQNPGTCIPASKTANATERIHTRLLYHILGVGPLAGQPARKPIAIVEMRKHDSPEACLLVVADDTPLYLFTRTLFAVLARRARSGISLKSALTAILFPNFNNYFSPIRGIFTP